MLAAIGSELKNAEAIAKRVAVSSKDQAAFSCLKVRCGIKKKTQLFCWKEELRSSIRLIAQFIITLFGATNRILVRLAEKFRLMFRFFLSTGAAQVIF